MEKFLLSFFYCLMFALESLNAQYATGVTIADFGNVELARKMEREASRLLTAFNDAFTKNATPSIDFVKDRQSIITIWAMHPFKCTETEIIERVYATYDGGYQIRDIPILLKDVSGKDATRAITINFDLYGNIYDIYFSIGNGDFLLEAKDVTDLKRRLLLVDFADNYLTAYYRKDISLINKVFSDDVIVAGREIKNIKSLEKNRPLPDATGEYLAGLKRIFDINKRIDFKINEIAFQQHTKYDHIYGVTFVQTLHLKHYINSSFVFLYIDFINKNEPLIKVRIWKSYEYGKEKYDLDDFM